MKIDRTQLLKIGDKALTFEERLEKVRYTEEATITDQELRNILELWEKQLGENKCNFEKRLAWSHTSKEDLKEKILGKCQKELLCVPEWLTCLEETLNYFSEESILESTAIFEKSNIGFKEIVLPFIEYAYKRIARNFKREITETFLGALIQILLNTGMQAFLQEFNYYKAFNGGFFSQNILYQGFINELKNEKIYEFFYKYSFLTRMLCTITVDITHNIILFGERVKKRFNKRIKLRNN